MGGHETIAAIAAQLDELRAATDTLRGKVAAWDARIEREGIGGTLVLRTEVKQLREKVAEVAATLAEALARNKLTDVPAPRWDGPAEDQRARFEGLHAWVEDFVRAQYPGYPLPACWPAHREALWELGTLHAEWRRVYEIPENPELAGALWWHERWLPGVLHRLNHSIQCDEAGCQLARRRTANGHHDRRNTHV